MEQKHRFRLLDIYRGIAALFVVFYHITTEMWYKFHHYIFLGNVFKFGNIGVDFFFVLSGFIIFYIHNKDTTSKKVVSFFKKRFIRIYPSYWAIVTVVLITYVALNSYIIDKPSLSLSYLVATYTLFPHIYRLIPSSWTLTEEVYFYLLFGILLFIPSLKTRLGTFLGVALVLFIASFFTSYSPIKEALITPYILEFVGGCISGYVFSYLTNKITKPYFIGIGIISFFLFFIALLVQTTFLRIPLITLSFSLFVWATGALEASYTFQVNKLLLLTGNASYVIYLMHAFIIKIIFKVAYGMHIISQSQVLLISTGLGTFIICTFLPILFYMYYEKPMLHFLRSKLL